MFPSRPQGTSALLFAFPFLLFLTGCGVGTMATNSAGTLDIRGNVYGGQQPVSGSNVYLYAAGTAGNGSASRAMLLVPVITDLNGNFSLTSDYICTNQEDQVYIVAQGGNPGLTAGTNNAALVMMSALGRCGDLPGTQFVSINELTTVAAVWALTPFITDYADLGASSTNAAGIKTGFLNARLLVNPSDGRNAVLPSNLTVESAKLNSLGNALAACINSDGTTACSSLFTAATVAGSVPTNTLQAALNVVRNPSNNVTAVFNSASGFAQFGSALRTAPHDWTMSMKVTGGGLTSPESLKVDAEGDIWVVNYNGGVSAFTPQGTPFSATGYAEGGATEWYDLVIDIYDDVWATIEEQPSHSGTAGSVVHLYGEQTGNLSGNSVGGYDPVSSTNSADVYDLTVEFPEEIAADTNGNIALGNEGNSRAEIFDHTGATVIDNLGANYAKSPVAIAYDSTHGIWLANQGGSTVTHVASDGTILANQTCCGGTDGVAVDSSGNAWFSDYYGAAIREVDPNGNLLVTTTAGGISGPARIFVDAKQDVWAADYRGNAFTHVAGNGGTATVGTALTPTAGGGLDAGLLQPFGISVDATGNLWVSSAATGSGITPSITMFFGLATPTKTPLLPVPTAP